jgi:hypothetical protein
MKITIEASDPTSYMGKGRGKVVIDTGNDEDTAQEAVLALRRAMIALDYDPQSIDRAITDVVSELSSQ